jgi:hypothetical protein
MAEKTDCLLRTKKSRSSSRLETESSRETRSPVMISWRGMTEKARLSFEENKTCVDIAVAPETRLCLSRAGA